MAAYASLVSVMHIVDQIKHHPHPPISLDKIQVESLTENIIFLQEFLESYSLEFGYRKEADPLEMRIADAAYAAEDVIESRIVDQIHAQSTSKITRFIKGFQGLSKVSCRKDPTDKFYQSLQKVIEDMDSLKKEVMKIRDKAGVRDQMLRTDGSLRSSAGQNMTMVGFDDELLEIMDQLTGGQHDRQIIPIVGMGGTGKTTLARNIYHHQVVVQHFDFRAWVTISQEYRMRECFLELLQEEGQKLSQVNEHELGDRLHKKLFGRRYLIIMDDVWDIEVWDRLRRFLPDNKNGSRIVTTTRISNFESAASYVVKMGFLDKYKSWSLFSKIVFEEEGCPLELEGIGMKIVENCRGLPLSIVVVGGLLAKSKNTREYWEAVAGNLNSIVNSDDDERCLKILHMSYHQLPVYLKPCFLYMGVFRKDREIRVSELSKLWVSEGFLKPISGRSLEEVADEYLQELINRNLILAHEVGSIGKVKYCKIHDLLRDLCLKQAEKERFYNVIQHFSRHVPLRETFYSVIQHRNCHVPQDTSTRRRIVIPEHVYKSDVRHALQTMSPARSLICNDYYPEAVMSPNFRLLRILFFPYHYKWFCLSSQDDVFKFVNIRCAILRDCCYFPKFVSSSKFWNLQTLISKVGMPTGLIDIWNMPQLRHVKLGSSFGLPSLPSGQDGIVLGNLLTLGPVYMFNCSEELAKRIPNIKKLKVRYSRGPWKGSRDYCANFGRLEKLETLSFWQQYAREGHDIPRNLSFPNSLKKLTLHMDNTYWEDKLEKVGSLPLLQKFKLIGGFFKEGKWETVEGQFPSLKFLSVEGYNNLKSWETENSHFPRLEHLVLINLKQLEELPCEIGEIPMLKSIKLWNCSNSAYISAKKIPEKQEELFGEVALQVLIDGRRLVSMTSPDSESE